MSDPRTNYDGDIYPLVGNSYLCTDLRPDKLDFRDLDYPAPVIQLPSTYPEKPLKLFKIYAPLVRDQGNERACVGFGLAAMINFLRWSSDWRRKLLAGIDFEPDAPKPGDSVSPRMIYKLAQYYDDYGDQSGGGSCARGAMKAWHKHGVCLEEDWRFSDPAPKGDSWRERAALCTVGAYYSVKKKESENQKDRENRRREIQTAIYDNGAVFASARTHSGWNDCSNSRKLPTIRLGKCDGDRHAFAMVGFNSDGFILQNSRGVSWGYHGFAVLSYEDWDRNGESLFVATVNVPTSGSRTAASSGAVQTETVSGGVYRKRCFGSPDPLASVQTQSDVTPWNDEKVYSHSVLMNDYGDSLGRLVTLEDANACVRHVCETLPLEEDRARKIKHIVIFAHSGLESETRAVRRASVLGAYFEANGIYPIFLSGRSGFVETVVRMLNLSPPGSMYGETIDGAIASVVAQKDLPRGECRDLSLEAFCQKFIRPLWTQFKTNASVAAQRGGAVYQLAQRLRDAFKAGFRGNPKVHLVGHSAGAILLGELLTRLRTMPIEQGKYIPVKSCTLLAPACSLSFANQHIGQAIDKGYLSAKQIHIDVLSRENELRDNVGDVYNKSLLYLISRALEERPCMPMLGLDDTWSMDKPVVEAYFDQVRSREVMDFRKLGIGRRVFDEMVMQVAEEAGQEPAAHDLFDNDLSVMTRVMLRILGRGRTRKSTKRQKPELDHPLKVLRGF